MQRKVDSIAESIKKIPRKFSKERKRQTSPRIKGRHLKASCCSLGWRSIIFAVYTLIQNWNERVTSEDTVYVLGDAFWKNEENSIQVMQQLNGHKHLIQGNHEWVLVEKWKKEQWAMGIPSRLINVGCMMDYIRYTPRTLTELLDANPMPEIARDRKDGSAVESAE